MTQTIPGGCYQISKINSISKQTVLGAIFYDFNVDITDNQGHDFTTDFVGAIEPFRGFIGTSHPESGTVFAN